MKHFIFDEVTRRCIGCIEGRIDGCSGQGVLVDADSIPPDVQTDDMSSLYLHDDGVSVVQDAAVILEKVKTVRIAAIKAEAAAHLDAIAWRLERAREREQAGWASLAELNTVLAQREAVRRSSSAAEEAVHALAEPAEVQAFNWTPSDVTVPVPRFYTHEQFIACFTPEEWEAMTAAAKASTAMDAWMRRFALATVVNIDDPTTATGLQMLELAGILAGGRAAEVLFGLTQPREMP